MKIYLVGGAVRDKLLGLDPKEKDWVVVGGTVKNMLDLGYKQVGKEFPVFLHPITNEEYALARMERKVKPGYQGFTFDTSTHVSLQEDLIRRDLTINAIAEDIETQQIIDPYDGQKDIEKKILRHVSPAFAEDPVRILRVGRFLARYAHRGFHVAPDTIELMTQMVKSGEVNALVAERVWKELERALSEKNPEKFFTILAECGALPILFPHLHNDGAGIKALIAAAALSTDPSIRFAALLHALPEDSQEKSAAKKYIMDLCNRYRAPNAYRELAVLTALHYEKTLHAKSLSADELLHLFSALDIYRRAKRFDYFLKSCQAIALSKKINFDPNWIFDCANAAKSVDVQALIAQDLDGAALAAALKEKRREKIAQWLE